MSLATILPGPNLKSLQDDSMDLSQLKSLGEVAGIGGIAFGGVVLLVRPLSATIVGLPKDARTGTVKLIEVGCFAIGALGVVAWAIGSRSTVSTSGSESPAVISKENTTINYGASSTEQQSAATKPASGGAPPSGTVSTKGNQSPGVISGGNVQIQYSTNPSTTSSHPNDKIGTNPCQEREL
jgi:hypothetical protein